MAETTMSETLLAVNFAVDAGGGGPKVEYLSDLQDRLISCTQGWGELRLDASAGAVGQASPKIRIKDKEYARGLGHHANSEIVVDLGGQFKTFEAEVGLQWSDGKSAGSVVFQVVVDGKKVFDSGVMRENEPPRPVSISVEGAEELRLIVTDAGDGITADMANWADARLIRDPAAKRTDAENSVNVARFARVLSWDPKVMEGTKASRSEEIPAEDIAPYREILPSADKNYSVPAAGDLSCIGLQWDENRLLRRVGIEFPIATAIPPVESIKLQFWTGESEWQGKWQTASITPERKENQLIWRFGFMELPQGTKKVRWIFSDAKNPIELKGFSAFTRSRWQTVELRLEAARPGAAKRAEIEIYNGEFLDSSQKAYTSCKWDGSKPLLLKVRSSAERPYKGDRTVLRLKTADAAFGIAVEDLLAHDCVYVPHANVFAAREPSPITAEEYLKRIAGQKSTLEEVRQKPDQDFRHAWAAIHNPTQDLHGWVPMLISLACDNRKFMVYRDGSIVFNEYNRVDDYPGESDGVHTIAANIGQWRFSPSMGSGQPTSVTRHLSGGWLPMPVTTVTENQVTYQQTTCVAPVGDLPADKPLWLSERAVAAAEYLVKNTGTEPSEAKISLHFAPQQDPKKSIELREVSEGVVVVSGDRVLAFFDKGKAVWTLKLDPTGIVLSSTLPPGGESFCRAIFPAWKLAPDEYHTLLLGDALSLRCERYWKALLDSAVQIDIPDELVGNLFLASQVHCMMAARNQEEMKYVVPWISSIHFAYPESEANSVIRGLDITGHSEVARRGLEFYLKECNEAGFITILVHNKAAGISCGYTIVGTGEVLWTLGEHFERTRDRAWLKKVAPEVARICKWIIKQREKTKRLDARGAKVPEYGLMPPGVSADWNQFAYRFFNEAQYYRGLANVGKALADIGDPAAQSILAEAEAYREDIVRAYHVMQAKMPVVPLKNGTWVPADPSLLGCYGNVENFLAGEDLNRSDVYSVELGAHHLVANEVLAPNSPDADWMIDYLEDVQFFRSNWIKDKNNFDAFDWGGFAKMQPYYCRIAEIHAQRDDVKPFIRSYFNMIPAQVNLEELSFWEDMGVGGYASGAFNKTHETGWFLGQTKTMFLKESDDALWLAPFVTNKWLKDGQKVAARNVPTRFGKVSYSITSKVAQGEIEAVVQLPKGCSAKQVVLRLRHPEGKPMQSVTVDGKPSMDFDREKGTISFPATGESITVKAKF